MMWLNMGAKIAPVLGLVIKIAIILYYTILKKLSSCPIVILHGTHDDLSRVQKAKTVSVIPWRTIRSLATSKKTRDVNMNDERFRIRGNIITSSLEKGLATLVTHGPSSPTIINGDAATGASKKTKIFF
jgi:hypothetical protein